MAILELVTSHSDLKDKEISPFTGNVILQLTGNKLFTLPEERIARIKTCKDDYDIKYILSMEGGKAEIIKKNEAKTTLVTELNEMAIELCIMAKGDREKLATTGFALIKSTERGKEPPKPTNFKVEYGVNEGSLVFSVKAHTNARFYVFLFTPVNSIPSDLTAWPQVSSTSSRKEIEGFKHGLDYLCRAAYMGPKGKIIYSDAISVLAR
ncbi:hypothetical protein [uncultured Acetobacteroides sp.]|uniref:hypothetical protein n=1 Tax=uncultured Acetobacteroides sp. TaxID=1760811 RepID=UPI0029F4BF68|nr:hypothetical protein [uncultured Acetobacteroides sp.]